MILQSAAGLICFLFLAWLLSENRRKISFRGLIIGIGLQLGVGIALLRIPVLKTFFGSLNRLILWLAESTRAGTSMVFGYLGGGPAPFVEEFPEASFILAFQTLPLILLISALSSLMFYWRILPFVVKSFSKLLQKTLSIGGAEGLAVAANVFLGMVESPLLIRPYLKDMTRSEIFSVMTCGMATIAGTVMVLYASLLSRVVDNVTGHILVASIISAPAAITVAKIMIPESGFLTSGTFASAQEVTSPMDAITRGTLRGVSLLINITAMLIVLVAIVRLANLALGLLPTMGGEPFTLQQLMGLLMAPVVWLMGIPWSEAFVAGQLMGTKTVLNELLAYLEMSQIPEGTLSPRSLMIMTYALCGFANPGSLGIMLGGLGTMAPERRQEIVQLGFRSIVAGTLATCMTGSVVGILG